MRIFPISVCLFQKDTIQIGDGLPSGILFEKNPGMKIDVNELCEGKKVIIFGIVSPFSPECTSVHFRSYLYRYEDFKGKGIDEVICIAVCDVFVAKGFSKTQQEEEQIRVFADPDGVFTKKLGFEIDLPQFGGIKSKRYAMLVIDNIVQQLLIEPDGIGLKRTLAREIRI